ncbi:AhpD-like protein [Aspergillus candidus]|uniref:AhpD-like protein n=1 Tax=Aspergillus candidus TaxID=41067 RepID=A0A2I2FH81_ASPCN|nr:AhpD-like protein [Aspergillus candidus]PLB39986.1 AhpD-like protein [Aspergillus candidus]
MIWGGHADIGTNYTPRSLHDPRQSTDPPTRMRSLYANNFFEKHITRHQYFLKSHSTTLTTTQSTMSSNPTTAELYEQGLQTRRAVVGEAHVERSLSSANAFTRPMQDIVTEFAWGNVWNRPGLDRKQRSLINIGMLTALNRSLELGVHVRGAVNNGLSELEIREAIIHATVYCGAPAGMEAMRTADRVLADMEEKGEMVRELK